MSYQRHVFVCENRRDNGEACCANHDAADKIKFLTPTPETTRNARTAAKSESTAPAAWTDAPKGRPLVVYPDGVWYRYQNESDLAEIAERHLLNGEIVERLRLPDSNRSGKVDDPGTDDDSKTGSASARSARSRE